mgnify:CR=1 FL=1
MALSTSTSTLAVGASRTFNLSPGSALTLVAPPNVRATITETPNTVSASGVGGNASRVHNLQLGQTVTYGPYPMGGTVVVANASNSGGAVTWVRSDSVVAESASGAVSLVSGDRNVLLVIPAVGSPSDLLAAPVQHVNITAAISTTATQAAAATGTYYKARVAWNNNGASGSAKLRIAVNCDNDVHGLMVGQSSKRRDYEMTMGDAVILVCSVPITRLTFSADGSITGGTHQLQVTFGN